MAAAAAPLAGAEFLALVGALTRLRKVAGSQGGEYMGPCPWCGGKDRFRVQPDGGTGGAGRWWCRQKCRSERWGSAIDYIMARDFGSVCGPDSPAWRERIEHVNRELGIEPGQRREPAAPREPEPPASCEPPPAAWRSSADAFHAWSFEQLWTNPAALDGLYRRGLTDQTISAAAIGWNPQPLRRPDRKWGLELDKGTLWLPAGYVFPWFVEGAIWKLNIRQPQARPEFKYVTIAGSSNVPYGIDTLRPGAPLALVEGPFDALAVQQAAGVFAQSRIEPDLGTAVAVGTTGARSFRWFVRFSLARPSLVALDDDQAGDDASAYWLDLLAQNARRLRPAGGKDPGEMLERDGDGALRRWLDDALVDWTLAGSPVDRREAA